ncbi:MAG: ATP:cob(I)alamin adenosyltransferase [Candidatus Omnitrophica bacterium 4484_70.2]|nr:MAG: ATP:cob(I)alamin adenosyltransferase [Candidatus Omnitrophica bacterium 4484_70.2]
MGIVTKRGDKGFTFLFQKRLRKSSKIIEAIGTLDELSSFLGIVKSSAPRKEKKLFEELQKDLILIGEGLAKNYLTEEKKKFLKGRIEWLEKEIEDKERDVKISQFILPGKNPLSAWFDLLRAITRKLERRIAALRGRNKHLLLCYLNRLSDFLFLYARKHEKS